MQKLFKGTLITLVVALVLNLLWLWFDAFLVGAYYTTASVFLSIIVGLSPIFLIVGTYYLVRTIVRSNPRSF